MKNTAFKILGVAAIAAAAFFSSCADPCKDVTCLNAGECVEGDCVCATGYEGTDCGTRESKKFAGNFNVAEVCGSGSYSYACVVTESNADVTKINFSNLYDFVTFAGITTPIYATVDGNNLAIPSQTVTSSGGVDFTVSGSGSVASTGVITITYTVTDGSGGSDTCTATYTPA
jgi:hypothetical protein